MAYSRNKRPTPVRRRRFNPKRIFDSNIRENNTAKKVILGVIALSMLAVILFTIYGFIATPEFLIKKTIESATADYYEEYFYNAILDNNSISLKDASVSTASPAISNILEKYTANGFSQVSLRQVLLSNYGKHSGDMENIAKYCDLDQTKIKIYPEPSYGRKNYHVDYTYSCKF